MSHLPDLPRLTRAHVAHSDGARDARVVPAPALLDLPEKAVQFGTGAFLRGFIDVFVHEANARGAFNGRIVAIGSTGSGRDQSLAQQDGLFTVVARGGGVDGSRQLATVVASVSRAISATGDWPAVLAVARNPCLEVIFSNTTEVGITLDEADEPDADPPRSFPGKLTRFLYERARAFEFAESKGVAVVPCELIEDNGERLRAIVLALAERWQLGAAFCAWIARAVPFYDTLVDRIVPGAPSPEDAEQLSGQLGYRDELITTCEPYRLFAIRADGSALGRLGFVIPESGIIIAEDISPYRERKVRLLNGTHTLMAPVGLLAGCETVLDAVSHDLVGAFARRAMLDEIVPSLDVPDAESYAMQVLARFANPYIRHSLIDITLQQTMKMRVRVVPSIVRSAARTGRAPASLAFGFAAYLLFMRRAVDATVGPLARPRPNDEHGQCLRDLSPMSRAPRTRSGAPI
jgi:tagaturonate reductase